jgi:hypothetical protein
MINILLVILGLVLVPFAESFFWTTGMGSLIIILTLMWMLHSRNDILKLVILFISGVIFDAGIGLNLGSSIVVIATTILGYLLFEKFLPMQNGIIKYVGIFILFLLGNMLFGFFASGLLTISLIPNSNFILSLLKSTFADIIIFFIIDIFSGMFSAPGSNKLKI